MSGSEGVYTEVELTTLNNIDVHMGWPPAPVRSLQDNGKERVTCSQSLVLDIEGSVKDGDSQQT